LSRRYEFDHRFIALRFGYRGAQDDYESNPASISLPASRAALV
jgi:hypothetical protein